MKKRMIREADVSRGCVLTLDSDAKLASSVTSVLLRMDDVALEGGKNYFVKPGTKLIPGVVTEILHTIDVNSGEEQRTDSLHKNEIAAAKFAYKRVLLGLNCSDESNKTHNSY